MNGWDNDNHQKPNKIIFFTITLILLCVIILFGFVMPVFFLKYLLVKLFSLSTVISYVISTILVVFCATYLGGIMRKNSPNIDKTIDSVIGKMD